MLCSRLKGQHDKKKQIIPTAILPLLVGTGEISIDDQKVGSAMPALNCNSAAVCFLSHLLLCVALHLPISSLKPQFLEHILYIIIWLSEYTLDHLLSKAALQEVLNILICSQLQRRSQGCPVPRSALQVGCALVKRVQPGALYHCGHRYTGIKVPQTNLLQSPPFQRQLRQFNKCLTETMLVLLHCYNNIRKTPPVLSVATFSVKHMPQCSLSPFDACCCQKNTFY